MISTTEIRPCIVLVEINCRSNPKSLRMLSSFPDYKLSFHILILFHLFYITMERYIIEVSESFFFDEFFINPIVWKKLIKYDETI